MRSIRQSKNVNESCTEKDPDVAVRAIRVIWLVGRSAIAINSCAYRLMPGALGSFFTLSEMAISLCWPSQRKFTHDCARSKNKPTANATMAMNA